MRRASRDLRTLAGRSEEELAGFTTSLLDVIRMAASAIERYTQVSVGRITELAVLGYAADDVGALMSALLDNATRYSPGTVTVSVHLLEDGGVMFRVEDTGIGIGADQVATVSYTHLRAHETRHDLVCRLLLEKKKKKTKQTKLRKRNIISQKTRNNNKKTY